MSAGYEGTQAEYYALVNQLPDTVEVASTIRQSVDDISNLVTDSAAGKARVIAALGRRGFTLPSNATYDEIAETIENMTWGEGILAKLGYESEADYALLKEQIDQAYMYKNMYEAGEIDTLKDCGTFAPKVTIKDGNADYLFTDKNNTTNSNNIEYFPEFEGLTSARYMFAACEELKRLPKKIDTSKLVYADCMFWSCRLTEFPITDLPECLSCANFSPYAQFEVLPPLNTAKCRSFIGFGAYASIKRIEQLDFSSIVSQSQNDFTSKVAYMKIINLGKSFLENYNFKNAYNWGLGGDENRQSLIDTLLTYSYDRAAAGMATCKITLHANTKALLTEEEIAAITAKGYTIA